LLRGIRRYVNHKFAANQNQSRWVGTHKDQACIEARRGIVPGGTNDGLPNLCDCAAPARLTHFAPGRQWKAAMKKIPKVTYQTVEELELRIKAREADAASLPAGEPRQSLLKEIARLRAYASVKQWLSEPPNRSRNP
jgi:hypothetical protein